MDKKKASRESENKAHSNERLFHKKLDRRGFLQKTGQITTGIIGGGVFGLLLLADHSEESPGPAVKTPPKSEKSPFQLGVASGDPLPDGVVLWTRLAPYPLVAGGGMSTDPVDVQWDVAGDKSFQHIVKQGTVTAEAEYAHSVHVEVEGLKPFHEYYYRFKSDQRLAGLDVQRLLRQPNRVLIK